MSDNSPFINIKIDQAGVEQIKRRLAELPSKLQKGILKQAVRKASNVIKDEAKRLAPVDDGKLRKSIMTEAKRGRPGDILFVVGPNYKVAPHGHLVEFGTAAHLVSAGKKRGKQTGKKVLYDYKTNTFFGKEVTISAKKKPFLRPAAEIKHQDAVNAFVTTIRERTNTWENLTMAGGI